MPATMTISQPTPGASPADRSKRDGVSDETVTVTLSESGTIEFMAVPPGVTTPTFAGGPTVYTFTPAAGVTGHKYILRSTATSDGSFSRRTFGIPDPFSGIILPAWNEIGDPDGYDGVKADAAVIDASDDNAADAVYTIGSPVGWTRDVHALGAVANASSSVGFPMLKYVSSGDLPDPRPANVFSDEGAMRAVINATPGPKRIALYDDLVFTGPVDLDGCFFYGADAQEVVLDDGASLLNAAGLHSLGFSNCRLVVDSPAAWADLGSGVTLYIKIEGLFTYTSAGFPMFSYEDGQITVDSDSAWAAWDGHFLQCVTAVGTGNVHVLAGQLELESVITEWIVQDDAATGTFKLDVSGSAVYNHSSALEGQAITAALLESAGWGTATIRRYGNTAEIHNIANGASPAADDGDYGLTVYADFDATFTLPIFGNADDGIGEILVVATRDVAPNMPVTINANGQDIFWGRQQLASFTLDSAGMAARFRPVRSNIWQLMDVYEPRTFYLKGYASGEESGGVWTDVGALFYVPVLGGQSFHLWENDASRARLGITAGADTAEMRLVDSAGTPVGGTWSNAGAPADVNLGSRITIGTAGWYQLQIRALAGTGTARLDGIDHRWIEATGGF